jgi:hypothetical protein
LISLGPSPDGLVFERPPPLLLRLPPLPPVDQLRDHFPFLARQPASQLVGSIAWCTRTGFVSDPSKVTFSQLKKEMVAEALTNLYFDLQEAEDLKRVGFE